MSPSIQALADTLRERYPLSARGPLGLKVGDCCFAIDASSEALLEELRHYFGGLVDEAAAEHPDIHIEAFHAPRTEPYEVPFEDWKREPGKKLKEAFADIEGGRVVHKVRTGMQFMLGPGNKIAVGDCLGNPNQVINFINSQYMNWLLHRGYALCHSAGVVIDDDAGRERGLGIAATSGAGKSTLALHLMNRGFSYTSNDRLLVRRSDAGTTMSGVPKLPRINPGTILNNATLAGILSDERRAELEDLPPGELWELEEKYDVFVEQLYGREIRMVAPIEAFFVLDWSRHDEGGPTLAKVDLAEREDLLALIMKPPGPFYEPPDGSPPSGVMRPVPAHYLEHLSGIEVYEISGGVDFEAAMDMVMYEVLGLHGAP